MGASWPPGLALVPVRVRAPVQLCLALVRMRWRVGSCRGSPSPCPGADGGLSPTGTGAGEGKRWVQEVEFQGEKQG